MRFCVGFVRGELTDEVFPAVNEVPNCVAHADGQRHQEREPDNNYDAYPIKTMAPLRRLFGVAPHLPRRFVGVAHATSLPHRFSYLTRRTSSPTWAVSQGSRGMPQQGPGFAGKLRCRKPQEHYVRIFFKPSRLYWVHRSVDYWQPDFDRAHARLWRLMFR